jgi:hypothetical protein
LTPNGLLVIDRHRSISSRKASGEGWVKPSRDTQAAGHSRYRRGRFGTANLLHAALNDGMFDFERFGNSGFHGCPSRPHAAAAIGSHPSY